MQAITPGAWSYDSFDPVEISIMTDKNLDDAISQEEERLKAEMLNGTSAVSESSLLQEESRSEEIEIPSDEELDMIETDSCDTSQVGMDAEEYTQALLTMQGDCDLRDMIDILEA